MSKVVLTALDFNNVDQKYLDGLSNDELLQVYVIAGCYWKVEDPPSHYPQWEKPTKLARKTILIRMKGWGR